jgi:hypothetical protein
MLATHGPTCALVGSSHSHAASTQSIVHNLERCGVLFSHPLAEGQSPSLATTAKNKIHRHGPSKDISPKN